MIEDYERHLNKLKYRKLARQNKARSAQGDIDKSDIDDITAAFQTSNRRFFSKSMAVAFIITGIIFACLYAIVISMKNPTPPLSKPNRVAIETEKRVVSQQGSAQHAVKVPATQPRRMSATDTKSKIPAKMPVTVAASRVTDIGATEAKQQSYDKRKELEEAKRLMQSEITRKSEALYRDKIASDEAAKAEVDRVNKLRKERRNTEEQTRGHLVYFTDE